MTDKLNENDIKVLRFISKYKMMKIEDAKLIYKTKRYYRTRINNLIEMQYIKRHKKYIVLDKKGRQVFKEKIPYLTNISKKSYEERHKQIADIAALTIESSIKFIPSWDVKDKEKYTETSRRYIGEFKIEGIKYLAYYLSKTKPHVYIKQMIFDIEKAVENQRIIIFVDNYDFIVNKYNNLSFGKDKTLIIINSKDNMNYLRNINNTSLHETTEKIYNQDVYLSDFEYADFKLADGRYIVYMPFYIDTEEIKKLNYHFEENTNIQKHIEILTFKENEEKIKSLLTFDAKIRLLEKDLLGGVSDKELY